MIDMFLAAFLPAPAPQEVVWKWVPDPTSCQLRQYVGDGRFLDAGGNPGGTELGLSIIDTGARIRSPKRLTSVQLSFLPGDARSVDAFLWPNQDPIGRTLSLPLGEKARAEFARASVIGIAHDEIGTMRVAVRSPGAALDAIRACEDRKLTEWGVDVAAWRALSAIPSPTTSVEKWFSYLDYPDREKIYANDIRVVARLDVAADGSVEKCTVVNRPPKEFVTAACDALLRNAKFNPARDAQNRPVAAPFIFRVSFAAFHL